MARTRIALRLAYLGGGFEGWQRQPGRRTVQGELERALATVFREAVPVVGAGRTDAGVHAVGQVAHLDPPFWIPPAGLGCALNAVLPSDVRVLGTWPIDATFSARASALGKRYRYRLGWGGAVDPWQGLRCWLLPRRPDVAAMRACLQLLEGTHDFAAFALAGHAGHGARGTRRTIAVARLSARARRADLVLVGDGFLRGMVRRIAGAMVEVGRGARPESWFADLVGSRPVSHPAPTAPAHGLTLEKVLYPRRRSPRP